MEVSVSPRATVCVLPPAACGRDPVGAGAAAGVDVWAEPSGRRHAAVTSTAVRDIARRFIASNVGISGFAWQACWNEAAGGSLPFRRFFLNFFACLSALKSQSTRFRGVQNKAMVAGRAHRTFPGRTQ